jgi:cytochrome P450
MTKIDTARAPVPPHVPPEKVIDYDVYKGYHFAEIGDLHQGFDQMGKDLGWGIFWTPYNGGHWLINDHELMFDAVRCPDVFSSRKLTIPPLLPEELEPRFLPLSLDPPIHHAYRMPLMKAFAPNEIKKMEAGIRRFSSDLIAGVAGRGQCEFIEAVGEPLPVTVFMNMMGMPLERMTEFREWMFDISSEDNVRRERSFPRILAAMGELIAERRIERKDDLISRLLDCDIEGRPPTQDEMENYCLLLFTAGLDTLVNSFTYAIFHLAGDPTLQDRLRGDPSLIPEMIEEVLRCYAVVMPPRIITYDIEFGGVQLKAGERVMMMLSAGNLDPKVFPDPMRFDIERENKAHITFNSGPHRCVGSHLARLEMRVFLEEWFRHMPNVRIDPSKSVVYRPGINMGVIKLPLLWEAENRDAANGLADQTAAS